MELSRLETRQAADEAITFVLDHDVFATPLTPGEIQVLRQDPYDSLEGQPSAYWFCRDATDRMAALIGIREHINHTGIYEMTCIAVSRALRQTGIGTRMLQAALQYIRDTGGRGMLVDTSDHPAYEPMRKLLIRSGFTRVGHLPSFYYPGEGTLLYYRLLEPEGAL